MGRHSNTFYFPVPPTIPPYSEPRAHLSEGNLSPEELPLTQAVTTGQTVHTSVPFAKTICNRLFPTGVHFMPVGSLNDLDPSSANLPRPREINIWTGLHGITGIKCLLLQTVSNFYLTAKVNQVLGSEKLVGFSLSKMTHVKPAQEPRTPA